ncbi:MAG: hypothetical protein M1526_02940 [Candidatus Thermoplasmatota archaeon]|nr:hypothetical protein [Candidatus Thermoplasmatota archaeon]
MVSEKAIYALLLVIIVIGGISTGAVYYKSVSEISPSTSGHGTQGGIYYVTLLETMNNSMGNMMQPRFFIVSNGGLISAINISLPSHTLIALTVISYDTPTPGTPATYSNVTGTVGNVITFINGTSATGMMVNASSSMQMMGNWEANVSSIPAGEIAHTITVTQIGLNIPVEGGFTEIAKFYVNSTGSYTWQCMSPCGTGSSGWGGAMATTGWMTGTFYIY